MNLPRHTLTSHALSPTFVNAQFHIVTKGRTHEARNREPDSSGRQDRGEGPSKRTSRKVEKESSEAVAQQASSSLFACATRQGYFITRTHPLKIIARRDFPANEGGLSHISLVDNTSLIVLVGGGRVPRFAPNKVILWDEDATRIVQVKRADNDTSSSSEGTASPLASTLFSVGREQGGGDMSNSRDAISVSHSTSRGILESDTENNKEAAMVQSEISITANIKDEDDDAFSGSVKAKDASAIDSTMSSSAYVEDPFGAPVIEAKAPEPSPTQSQPRASKERSASQSTGVRSVSHIIRKGREVAEMEFGEAVKGICVRSFDLGQGSGSATILVVILNSKAVVFELGTHIPLEQHTTDEASNTDKPRWGIRQCIVVEIRPGLEKGLASMAQIDNSNCVLLALPGRQTGHVQLLSIALSNTSRTSIRSSIAGASTIIAAHANAICSITLSEDARLLCTASERGTLLRVWSTQTASSQDRSVKSLSTSLVGELRRGSDAAKILSVAFSPDGLLLAAGSDKGTIHFFNLYPLHQLMSPLQFTPKAASKSSNNLSKKANKYLPPSVQNFAGSIPPSLVPQYLKSHWSFTQFKVPLRVFSSSVAEGTRSSPVPLYRRSGAQDRDEYGEGDVPGKDISLEGGWAGMRGRIDDVRKGEKGIEEGMWLTWIPAGRVESNDAQLSSTKVIERHSDETSPFELVVITSSGSHYRIGVAAPDQDGVAKAAKKTTVLDMYKEDSSSQYSDSIDKETVGDNKTSLREQCWLLEYQRFGMRDEWVD